jgi:hypothetical protein
MNLSLFDELYFSIFISKFCALDDTEMESETAEQCDRIFPTSFPGFSQEARDKYASPFSPVLPFSRKFPFLRKF